MEEGDVPQVHALLAALARFEKLEHGFEASEEALMRHAFGDRPIVEGIVSESGGRIVGAAVFFFTYSTFKGGRGIWLEDLFVLPEERGKGHGRALLGAVLQRASDEGCRRVEWSVLEWNESAIRFYESAGAAVLPDWRICRWEGFPEGR
jgi:GNAT superfamily N-acetyltransferase